MTHLDMIRPDDCHVHLREGSMLSLTLRHTRDVFGRAVVMPNLKDPLDTVEKVLRYKDSIIRVMEEQGDGHGTFSPLMTLYLNEHTSKADIIRAKQVGILGAKYYPKGATTQTERSVGHIAELYPLLEVMEREGLVLMVHGEVSDERVDVFDLERVFVERVLGPLLERFQGLRVTLEHLSTKEAVACVRAYSSRVAGTITAHHLLLNRNALLYGGLRPHHYCFPILKTEEDRQALIEAATSEASCFFLGTDSAPHSFACKESPIGSGGIYTAPYAMSLYAEVFEEAGRLDRLESFSSLRGSAFYGLKPNAHQIRLVKELHRVPESYVYGDGDSEKVIPFRANETLRWRIKCVS